MEMSPWRRTNKQTNKQTKSENRASQPFDTRAAGLLTFATSGCFCLVCTVFWDSAANVLLIVFNNYCFNLIFQPQPPRKVLIRVIFLKKMNFEKSNLEPLHIFGSFAPTTDKSLLRYKFFMMPMMRNCNPLIQNVYNSMNIAVLKCLLNKNIFNEKRVLKWFCVKTIFLFLLLALRIF